MEKLLKYLPFLRSTRFWTVVVIALAMLLNEHKILSDDITGFILTIGFSHIGIRTIDKATEKSKTSRYAD